ncbi:MAG: hypothetical protein JWL61_5292 [Gemmatimonadetes bacterium]|nr:hypothetical protein [Gemmatimonadota bacterium]
MSLIALALFAQLAAPTRTLPVLSFPERGLDDSAAYLGYQTRLFRDARGNTVQIYLDARADRVVHLWADAEDESLGFTARSEGGRAANLQWNGDGARISATGRTRTVEHDLIAYNPRIDIGWFLLGSMRVERDLQYAGKQKSAFAEAPFKLPELDRMLAAFGSLSDAERRSQLAMLHAPSVDALRARLRPTVASSREGTTEVVRVSQPALDGLDTLVMELRTDPQRVAVIVQGDSVALRAKSGADVPFTVRITTSGKALTPLTRAEIFTPEFLAFVNRSRATGGATDASSAFALRGRRLERQVRGLELLVSHEKLMAGLPTYATYFGRDMLMTALMMRPVWRDEMNEFVIASVLRKLSPEGHVSHEEAMGGQAVREAASEYASLVDAWVRAGRPAAPDTLLSSARRVLRDVRRTRENYHMIDAEYQFPIIVARWLSDNRVSAARKRAFLLDKSDGGENRLTRLTREIALVARATAPYAANPLASNLISFAPRDSGRWASQSWRDSNVGYAGGRYAMDVNVVWAPHALESVGIILDALRALKLPVDASAGAPLGRYVREPQTISKAVETWRSASHHFEVSLTAAEVRQKVAARLAAMTDADRAYWTGALSRSHADTSGLTFLAIALDGSGRPIPVANSDVATRLFLGDNEGAHRTPDASARAAVLRDVRLFARQYPVGLLVDGVGPVVANDAYASPAVWRDFDRDRYHSPRVVWGRENNLFLIGVMNRMADAGAGSASYVSELRRAATDVLKNVESSGFHSELWSYEVRNGKVVPIRYGSGSDVQLWSTTDLVVQFQRARAGM